MEDKEIDRLRQRLSYKECPRTSPRPSLPEEPPQEIEKRRLLERAKQTGSNEDAGAYLDYLARQQSTDAEEGGNDEGVDG